MTPGVRSAASVGTRRAVVFADATPNQVAHLVPISATPDPTEIDLKRAFTVPQQGDAFWVNNTLSIIHDLNANNQTMDAAYWKEGMTGGAMNVTAFATVAPSEDDSTASLVVNSARTVDATPPFDAAVKAPL